VFFDQPRLVVEILSPSTEADDRSSKLDVCKTFASLQAILFVRQDSRGIELHGRGSDVWIVEDWIGSGTARLHDLAIDLTLETIYGT